MNDNDKVDKNPLTPVSSWDSVTLSTYFGP